jgi:hypothetical protein
MDRRAIFHFRFEEDFVEEGVRCIPMIVRFKLDLCGIKLKLAEWSRMNELERHFLAELACDSAEEILVYRNWLQMTVYKRTGAPATDLQVEKVPAWKLVVIPAIVKEKLEELQLSLNNNQWQSLTDLQRFALLKLSRPGHENRNFPFALQEFLEISLFEQFVVQR